MVGQACKNRNFKVSPNKFKALRKMESTISKSEIKPLEFLP